MTSQGNLEQTNKPLAERAKDFWNFFENNRTELEAIPHKIDVDTSNAQQILHNLRQALAAYSGNKIKILFRWKGVATSYELVFTARGQKAYFHLINYLLTHKIAPTWRNNWAFTSLKQPIANEISVRLEKEEMVYSTTKILCQPYYTNLGQIFGLQVFFDKEPNVSNDKYVTIVNTFLEKMLGERGTALNIQQIYISSTNEIIDDEKCFLLSELPSFLKEYNKRYLN